MIKLESSKTMDNDDRRTLQWLTTTRLLMALLVWSDHRASVVVTAFSTMPHGHCDRTRQRTSLLTTCSYTTPSVVRQASVDDNTLVPADVEVLMGDDDVDLVPFQAAAPQRSTCVTGVVARSGPLNEAVVQIMNQYYDNENKNDTDNDNNNEKTHKHHLSLQDANELVELGAVWARMETLSRDEIIELYDGPNNNNDEDNDNNHASARAMYADLPKGWGAGVDDNGSVQWQKQRGEDGVDDDLDEYVDQMREQRFRRVLTPSRIDAGVDLRIYPTPRRFPACYDMTKENALLYEDTTFVVVDKPPLLPTQPDASNYEECCPGCVARQLGPFVDILGQPVQRPLLCHRVDSVVGGCVVLSKDRKGQKVFHELQRDRKLRKIYKAVTTQPVPTGMHVHWMWAPQSARGTAGGPPCQLVSHALPESRRKARQFWNRCVLEVVKCERIEIDVVTGDGGHTYRPDSDVVHYQSTIRLVTGRKHQVRAQLASLGCPIIRDTLYQPMSGMTLDRLEEAEKDMDECIAQCRVPREPIGLQAAGILFGGIKARAKTPWWGDRVVTNALDYEM